MICMWNVMIHESCESIRKKYSAIVSWMMMFHTKLMVKKTMSQKLTQKSYEIELVLVEDSQSANIRNNSTKYILSKKTSLKELRRDRKTDWKHKKGDFNFRKQRRNFMYLRFEQDPGAAGQILFFHTCCYVPWCWNNHKKGYFQHPWQNRCCLPDWSSGKYKSETGNSRWSFVWQ